MITNSLTNFVRESVNWLVKFYLIEFQNCDTGIQREKPTFDSVML